MRSDWLVAAGMIALLLLVPAGTARADGGEEDVTAFEFVEQAIGLLRGQPEQADLIEDRIEDALEDDETEGVDLALVEEAAVAFDDGRLQDALELLQRSIGEEPVPASPNDRETGGGLEAPEGAAGPVLLGLAVLLALSGLLVVRGVR